MEAVPVTGIPPWDRGMGQGEMRIFRFDLGQPVRVSKHKPRKSRNAVGQVGKPWGSFSPPILTIVPAVPARPCMRGGTGTGIRPHLFLTRVLWRAKYSAAQWVSGTTSPAVTDAGIAGMQS